MSELGRHLASIARESGMQSAKAEETSPPENTHNLLI
jgi:hypothetical protein